jgi:uncharacterized cupredoxin-like copper-binding protein
MKLTTWIFAMVLAGGCSWGWSAEMHAAGHDHPHGPAQSSMSVGQAGEIDKVQRTLTLEMSDAMRFTPSSIQVKSGETIRFILKNTGKVKHEFVLGTDKEIKEHDKLMKKHPNMVHDDPQMVSVPPGQTGEVIWYFTKPGKVSFACLQPGHFDAGMKGRINVTGAIASSGATASKAGPAHQH